MGGYIGGRGLGALTCGKHGQLHGVWQDKPHGWRHAKSENTTWAQHGFACQNNKRNCVGGRRYYFYAWITARGINGRDVSYFSCDSGCGSA